MNSTYWSSTFSSTITSSNPMDTTTREFFSTESTSRWSWRWSTQHHKCSKTIGSVWVSIALSLWLFWSHQYHHYLSSTNTSFSINKFSLYCHHHFRHCLSGSLYLRFPVHRYWSNTDQSTNKSNVGSCTLPFSIIHSISCHVLISMVARGYFYRSMASYSISISC